MRSLVAAVKRVIRKDTNWAAGFFTTPLVNLGTTDVRLRGIQMPEREVGEEKIGLSEQFLANAEQYHARYSASDDSTMLFRSALAEVDWKPSENMTILDIGTGSGANSVIPSLRIFEGCKIVATDLSPDLLALLHHYLESENLSSRVACICTDSMNNHFKDGAFDVVLGSAILHHLIDPEAAIRTAYKALKPGGIAMFIEPFEGFSLLAHAFNQIMSDANESDKQLSDDARAFLKAICTDLDARKGTDKSDIKFRYMDDKWLFTRTYIDAASSRAGFKSAKIVPYLTPDASRHYRSSTEILMRCSGLDPNALLPVWAWESIDSLDRLFSPEMKRDALLEGTIILQK